MMYLDEYRDAAAAGSLARRIAAITTRPWVLMEVCGGQTHAIVRYGLDQLLPPQVELVHGPGCPVCVTPLEVRRCQGVDEVVRGVRSGQHRFEGGGVGDVRGDRLARAPVGARASGHRADVVTGSRVSRMPGIGISSPSASNSPHCLPLLSTRNPIAGRICS